MKIDEDILNEYSLDKMYNFSLYVLKDVTGITIKGLLSLIRLF